MNRTKFSTNYIMLDIYKPNPIALTNVDLSIFELSSHFYLCVLDYSLSYMTIFGTFENS
jgi:hypothetical protein